MSTKHITVQLSIHTLQSNYAACEMIEQVLMNSSLNNSELKLEIKEVKVTHEEEENQDKK